MSASGSTNGICMPLLRREGCAVNRKRVQRLYREEQPMVRMRVPWGSVRRCPCRIAPQCLLSMKNSSPHYVKGEGHINNCTARTDRFRNAEALQANNRTTAVKEMSRSCRSRKPAPPGDRVSP